MTRLGAFVIGFVLLLLPAHSQVGVFRWSIAACGTAWQATHSETLNSNATGFVGFNIHQLFANAGLSTSGCQVRITINAASTGEGFQTQDCFIQQVGGAGPTRITFNGGSSSVTVPVNTTLVSDSIAFVFDKAKDTYISFYPNDAANDDVRQNFTTQSANTTRFTMPGSNDAANPTNLSGYAGGAAATIVSLIEVLTP
jgi:hypothetical protein